MRGTKCCTWIKEKSFHARGFGVISVLNSRSRFTFLDLLQLIVSFSGICSDIKIDAIDSSEYNIKCIDMFNNTSLEFYIVIHNPMLRPILVKIFTMIQDAVREKEKSK
jgi:hypothetical protein